MNLDEFLYNYSSLFEDSIDEYEIRKTLENLREEDFNELLADLAKSFRGEFIDIVLDEILDTVYAEDSI